MRLIDRDALLTWFNDHYDDEEVTVGYVSGLIKDAPTIEREITEEDVKEYCKPRNLAIVDGGYFRHLYDSKVEPMQWIPVAERLPKKDGDYLVTTYSGQIARYVFVGGSSEGYWRRCATAWMPLPAPYTKVMQMVTCENCYWYSDIGGVKTCEHEHEPTTPYSEACGLFEDRGDADGRT